MVEAAARCVCDLPRGDAARNEAGTQRQSVRKYLVLHTYLASLHSTRLKQSPLDPTSVRVVLK